MDALVDGERRRDRDRTPRRRSLTAGRGTIARSRAFPNSIPPFSRLPMKRTIPALLTLCWSLAGCSSIVHIHDIDDGTVLVDRVETDGSRVVYRLRASDQGAPKLIRDRHQTVKRVRLPVTVADLNKDRAAALGVEAWKGVYVENVAQDGSLAKCGLRRGDVLLTVNGMEFTNARQFNELAAAKLSDANTLQLAILRGEDGKSWTGMTLTADADLVEVRDSARTTTDLSSAELARESMGMQIAEIPAEQAREIFGVEEPVLVVTSVEPGTPGYLAGIRARDRVLELDGKPVRAASDADNALRDAIAKSEGAGEVVVAVDGPLGSLTAPVAVDSDLESSSEFTFPILWCYERDHRSLNWGCLQFIFLFGGRYEREYLNSSTRKVAYRSSLELLPLGLFEIEEDPHEKEIEFLWFIHHRWSKR
jgi:hypothetical protein